MSYSVFMKFEPEVAGESSTKGYEKQIELTRWNFGVANGVYMDSGKKLQAGTVSCETITVHKKNDSATAALMSMCAKGKTGKGVKVTLSVCVSDDAGPKPIITILLENTIVTSVAMTGYGEGQLEDVVSLAYSKVSYQYENKDAKGTNKTKPKFTYDLELQTGELT